MEVKVRAKYVRAGAKKLRVLRPLVLGKKASYAIALLKNTPRRGATLVRKTLETALAQAKQHHEDEAAWQVKNLVIDEGPRLKRSRAAAMGRGVMVHKRMSHITVVVEAETTGSASKKSKMSSLKFQRV